LTGKKKTCLDSGETQSKNKKGGKGMGALLGMSGKLYRNKGTYGSPVWDEIDSAREVAVTLSKGEADASTRGTGGWKATKSTLKDLQIEYTLVYNPDSPDDFDAVRDAFLAGTQIEFLILDGAKEVSGSQGPRAICEIFNFSRSEPLEEVMTVKVTAKPTPSANAPSWYEVS
jgi:hypothetical protein